MNRYIRTAAALALAAALLPALAAEDDGHPHAKEDAHAGHDVKPAHGGVVAVVKDVNYELVAKPDSIALHVADHGKPVDLAGASAKLTMLSKAGKSEATLAPSGDKLAASGSFKVEPGTKVVAVVTLAGKPPVSARFTLK